MTSRSSNNDSLLYLSLSVLGTACITGLARKRITKDGEPSKMNGSNANNDTSTGKDEDGAPKPTKEDLMYLKKAQQFRSELDLPKHSSFRVVCILLVEDTATRNTIEIYGTNDESSPSMSGSICAERAALLNFRIQRLPKTSKIQTVYIVTDADVPVAPGTMCREYMIGHDAIPDPDRVRIVIQSCDTSSKPWIIRLSELYPYPSLYNKMTAVQQLDWANAHKHRIQVELGRGLVHAGSYNHQIGKLLASAHEAAAFGTPQSEVSIQYTNQNNGIPPKPSNTLHHPIRYGAAAVVYFSKTRTMEYWESSQIQNVEYGSSQDAVCCLLSRIITKQLQEEQEIQQSKQQSKANQSATSPSQSSMSSSSTSASASSPFPSSPSASASGGPTRFLRVLALVQVDQFGIPHAPFAPARSLLVEHGFSDCPVVLTARHVKAGTTPSSSDDATATTQDSNTSVSAGSDDGYEFKVVTIRAGDLAPHTPNFRGDD